MSDPKQAEAPGGVLGAHVVPHHHHPGGSGGAPIPVPAPIPAGYPAQALPGNAVRYAGPMGPRPIFYQQPPPPYLGGPRVPGHVYPPPPQASFIFVTKSHPLFE